MLDIALESNAARAAFAPAQPGPLGIRAAAQTVGSCRAALLTRHTARSLGGGRQGTGCSAEHCNKSVPGQRLHVALVRCEGNVSQGSLKFIKSDVGPHSDH